MAPITVSFKMLFQRLCKDKLEWDEVLTGDHLDEWNRLTSMLQSSKPVVIPRYIYSDIDETIKTTNLIGFCDASEKAYAALVYLRTEFSDDTVHVNFLAAKTRVSPLNHLTIPRLELLSALLLANLIISVQDALKSELLLSQPICYSDSKIAISWIRGEDKEWQQFVENRVNTIRKLVSAQYWRHCPGRDNPADTPSRGSTPTELSTNQLWLNGPTWLYHTLDLTNDDFDLPEECYKELKRRVEQHVLLSIPSSCLSNIIDCEKYSSLHRLLRVTSLVVKFIHLIRPTFRTYNDALLCWLIESQRLLPTNPKFLLWKRQFRLFQHEFKLWRCNGRLSNSSLSTSAQTPILLESGHHITRLIVQNAHQRVMHNGVRETLNEIRTKYWLIQYVRKSIHHCLVCKRYEGQPHQSVPPPSLPEYRVKRSRPFVATGVDFAGPLYVKSSAVFGKPKVWLCIYTCCATRAVHLDIVPNLDAQTFIRSFKRFTARRGIPAMMISDNGRTFKSAAKLIEALFSEPKLMTYLDETCVKWKFNLEKAPWQGGIFERMIKSAKRCLRKSIGRNSLTYEELVTLVIEVEAVLNSRPLTYIVSDDFEEPLTPSHLLIGFRVLSLPDPITEQNFVDDNLSTEALIRRRRHLSKTLDKFWKQWKREYLHELREHHRHFNVKKGITNIVTEGEIVTVYDEGHPRGLWRLGRILEVIKGTDGNVRGALVRVQSKSGRSTILRRPIQQLYPLEVYHVAETSPTVSEPPPSTPQNDSDPSEQNNSMLMKIVVPVHQDYLPCKLVS